MDKILLQELADGLSARKSITKKEAENFIRTAFEVIEEYLLSDQIVKVKGLGTFKLVTVGSRESVNVNTGERITIDSHTKISFTPDKALSDHVNRPFADFDTVVLNDDTRTEDMERIDETADKPAEEPVAEPVTESVPVVEEPVTESPVAETSVVEEPVIEEPVAEEPITTEPTGEEPAVEKPVEEKPINKNSEEPKKNRRGWLWGLLFGLVALILCFLFFGKKGEAEVPQQEVQEAVETEETDTIAKEAQATEAEENAAQPSQEQLEEQIAQYPQVKYGKYWIVGVKATYILQKGDDLSKLALEYYGDKHLISYIIRFNNLRNPSHVGVGQEIKIPELVAKPQE